MTLTKCPTCNQFTAPNRVLVTLEANTIMYQGKSLKVTGKEAELLFLLAEARPRPVSYGHLIRRMYPMDEPDTVQKCLQVFVCRLRKQLGEIGLDIDTILGRSYQLVDFTERSPKRPTLSIEAVRAIRSSSDSLRETAARFHCSPQNVRKILKREIWKHVT